MIGRMTVTVVGAGVVGLSCAVALREAGFSVRVVAGAEPGVSAVAGGLWLPYTTGSDARALGWARATYERLEAEGAPLVSYRHVERAEPGWLPVVPDGRVRRLSATSWVAEVPLVEMPRHLASLRERAGGVSVSRVSSLAEVPGLVVNCTGLAARWLADDADVVPVRGQVVHVRPRDGVVVPCVCDEDELTYVLPRPDVCVLGGFAQEGDDDVRVREAESADILSRCMRLVPELEGCTVLGAHAGLRPLRRGGARVERVGDVVHCYGHGGAGLTLSWGCAAEVVELAGR
jgi:D-amino-acid oxidase